MNSHFRLAAWCLPVATAIIGWVAGSSSRLFEDHARAQVRETRVTVLPAGSAAVSQSGVVPTVNHSRLDVSSGLKEALSAPSRLHRQIVLRHYLESLDTSALAAVFAQVNARGTPYDDETLAELFRVWIQRDVNGAAAHD